MLPKEEAEYLVKKYWIDINNIAENSISYNQAKTCALICIETILEVLPKTVNALEVHYQNVRREIELL